jgi:hypothetical protein
MDSWCKKGTKMHITENELITLQRANAIRGVCIKGTDAGFCVNFEIGNHTATLMTSRNEVRYWGQLNRLANWLKERDMPALIWISVRGMPKQLRHTT